MPTNLINVQISASAVAWYGAIVATFGFIFSTYNILRDRAKIRISYRRNSVVMNYPPYDHNKKYITISVVNKGRRTVRIGNVAVKLFCTKGYTLVNDSIVGGRNQILTEENPQTVFFIEEECIKFDNAYCIFVYDGAGREYKKYTRILPTLSWVLHWMKNKK